MTDFSAKGLVTVGQDEPSPGRRFLADQVNLFLMDRTTASG